MYLGDFGLWVIPPSASNGSAVTILRNATRSRRDRTRDDTRDSRIDGTFSSDEAFLASNLD
jgi:hypothetical protein